MTNNTFKVTVQLKDVFKNIAINDSGAVCFVCNTGTPVLATITDLNGNALANPLQLTSGLIAFEYQVSASGGETGVDLFGMTAKGHWFEYTGITPSNPSGPNEILVDTSIKRMRMKIPFAIGNTGPAATCAAATEFKTGMKLPPTAFVLNNFHGTGILVTTGQSGKTIEVGILSTETGGAASGFINGSSLTTAGQVAGTDGSLFSSDAAYLTDTGGGSPNGLDISLTLSSGTTTGAGFALLDYRLSA